MSQVSRIVRPNVQQDAHHLAQGKTAIALGGKLLADNPPPDTFAGNETHEPFPKAPDGSIAPSKEQRG